MSRWRNGVKHSLAGVFCLVWTAAVAGAGTSVPELHLRDLQGQTTDLRDYRGKVVLVNFWATWCPPCLVEMPAIQRLQERLANRAFIVLAVNAGEDETTLWQTRQRFGLQFPLLLDRDLTVTRAWGVEVYPTSFVLDTGGHIVHRFQGLLDWSSPEAVAMIQSLLPKRGDRPDQRTGSAAEIAYSGGQSDSASKHTD